jgi:hypothetical protein
MLIDGTMGTMSKAMLCALALAATVKALVDLRGVGLAQAPRLSVEHVAARDLPQRYDHMPVRACKRRILDQSSNSSS